MTNRAGEDTFRTVTIRMADSMYDDLRACAESEGITVTELMRRAVSLYRMVYK